MGCFPEPFGIVEREESAFLKKHASGHWADLTHRTSQESQPVLMPSVAPETRTDAIIFLRDEASKAFHSDSYIFQDLNVNSEIPFEVRPETGVFRHVCVYTRAFNYFTPQKVGRLGSLEPGGLGPAIRASLVLASRLLALVSSPI